MKKILNYFIALLVVLLVGLIVLNIENNFQYNKKINNMEEKIKNIKKENDSIQNKKNKRWYRAYMHPLVLPFLF